jgi:hypothetical protein
MGVSGQRHAPAAHYPRGKDPRYPLYRRLGGPRAGLDTEATEKILCLCRGSNFDSPVVQSLVWLTELPRSNLNRITGCPDFLTEVLWLSSVFPRKFRDSAFNRPRLTVRIHCCLVRHYMISLDNVRSVTASVFHIDAWKWADVCPVVYMLVRFLHSIDIYLLQKCNTTFTGHIDEVLPTWSRLKLLHTFFFQLGAFSWF